MEYPYNPKNLLRIFIISLKYFINPPFYNDKALQSMGIFCFFVINAVREVAMHIHRDWLCRIKEHTLTSMVIAM